MQTVYPNKEIPHLWAHRAQDHAKNAGNTLRFERNEMYSYQTLVAKLVDTPKGGTIALISSNTYSPTTGKQLSYVHRAVSHMSHFVVSTDFLTRGTYTKANVQAQAAEFEAEATRLILSASRAKGDTSRRLTHAQEQFDLAVALCAAFGIQRHRKLVELVDVTQLTEERKRHLEKERAIAKKREEKEKLALVQRRAEDKPRFEAWLAGEPVYWPTAYNLDDTAYLRVVNGDVQTSLGATVPLADVLRIMPLVLRCIKAKIALKPDPGSPIRFGPYKFSGMSAKGVVTVGCHKFNKEEILRFAGVLEKYQQEVSNATS